ncbi:MAG: transglycosylase SLT domain-containing protein, partial [Dehalococcoidia bacterium]|nr:transglycosylase SLT domain-containing protein [Dehalococcoidia bacterium]
RALAYSESSLDPLQDMADKPSAHSSAVGLFQVMNSVLSDWNLRHPEEMYTREQLKDPRVNTRIAIALLERIIKSYVTNHRSTLLMDWRDPRWVTLLVAGYNAGYSEAGGVGRIVDKMEAGGLAKERVTVEGVQQIAAELRRANPKDSARFLADPARLAYWKLVTQRYLDDLGPRVAQAGRDGVGDTGMRPVGYERAVVLDINDPKRPSAPSWSTLGWLAAGLAGLWLLAGRASRRR